MNKYILGAIVLSAMITFLLRALPFLLFKEKELPEWLKKIEKKITNDYYGSSYCLLSKGFKNTNDNTLFPLFFSMFNCCVYL